MNDPNLQQRARRRVALKMGWWIHATVFVLVNAGLWLAAQGLFAGTSHHLPVPLWGWALGLAIHGLVTLARLQGEGLSQRLVQAEIQRLRHLE